jgi:hypothetical protein
MTNPAALAFSALSSEAVAISACAVADAAPSCPVAALAAFVACDAAFVACSAALFDSDVSWALAADWREAVLGSLGGDC